MIKGLVESSLWPMMWPVKSKVCLRAKWPIRIGAYPGFCGMKQLGVFFTPPWMRCQFITGLPPAFRQYPFIHLGGERHHGSKVSCPRTQHNDPGQDPNPRPLNLESSTLTMRPPRLQRFDMVILLQFVSLQSFHAPSPPPPPPLYTVSALDLALHQ